ncbi:MAG: DUF4038 domain-containing protein [Paludibacter sp.]|nr:DUF4038 domain-containing protein [Paludibacter sp.]
MKNYRFWSVQKCRLIKMLTLTLLLSVIFISSTQARTVAFTAPTGTIEQYQMIEYKFVVTNPVATNGFTDVTIASTFTPSGKSAIIVNGFCDSNDGTLFYQRFTPVQTGQYSYTIKFTDSQGTETYTGTFNVVAGTRKGFALPNKDHGGTYVYKFTYSNGEFFMPSSQTAWMLLDCTDAQWKAYIDRTAARNQNVLRYAFEGDLYNGTKIDALNCWPMGGTRNSPDFNSFNLAYWRKVETILKYAEDKNILAELVLAEAYQSYSAPWTTLHKYLDYVVARLSPLTSVFMYETFNESTNNKPCQKEIGDYLDLIDPYKHPIAPSPGTQAEPLYGSESWVDVSIYHSCTGSDGLESRYYTWALGALKYNKPAWCDEMGREVRHNNNNAEHRRKQLWTLNIAGTHWNYHSGEGCEEIQDITYTGPGSQYIQYIQPFWKVTDWLNLKADDNVFSPKPMSQYCHAMRAPNEIVSYFVNETAGAATSAGTFGLKAPDAGTVTVMFYNPKTGTYFTNYQQTYTASAKDMILTVNYPAFTDDLVMRAYTLAGPQVSISAVSTIIKTGTAATFNVVASVPAGSAIASYQWNLGGTLQNGTGTPAASVPKIFTTAGEYDVTLSITDNGSPAKTAISGIVHIKVVDNFPPVISKVMYELTGTLNPTTSIDRTTITNKVNEKLDFLVQATDAENNTLTYAWDLDGNGSYETSGQNVQKTFTAAGTVNGSVQVSDGISTPTMRAIQIKVNPLTPSAFLEAGGLVSMEAENMTASDSRIDPGNLTWTTASSQASFSGTGYIQTANSGSGNGDWVNAAETSYDVKFATTGTYKVWIRRYAPDGASNSVYIGLNNIALASIDNGEIGAWGWYKFAEKFTISAAGTQTVQLRRREDGYIVDKIVLSTDANYDPSVLNGGLGPVESNNESGIIINTPPVVSIAAPTASSSFTLGSTIDVTVNATDNDGIEFVDFYAGSELIGTASTLPYTINWTPTAVGTYTISAFAQDSKGASSTSTSVTIIIKSNTSLITNSTKANVISVYPNPFTTNLFVHGVTNGSMEIYNNTGSRIRSLKITNIESSIDLSNLYTGFYIIKINSQNGLAQSAKINKL